MDIDWYDLTWSQGGGLDCQSWHLVCSGRAGDSRTCSPSPWLGDLQDHYARWWGTDCKTKSRIKDLATFVMLSNKVIVFVRIVKTATTVNVATTALVAMAVIWMWLQVSGRPISPVWGWTYLPTSWRHMCHLLNCEGGCSSMLGSRLRACCINVHVSVQSGPSIDNKKNKTWRTSLSRSISPPLNFLILSQFSLSLSIFSISLHFPILSPFPFQFLVRSPFSLHFLRSRFPASCRLRPLQCLAGYYHINAGHLLDTKNK